MRIAESRAGAIGSFLLRRASLRARGLRFKERTAEEIPAEELLRVDTCWSVATGLSLVDTMRGAEFQTAHLMLALEAGEPYRVARALAVEAGYRSTRGGRGLVEAEHLVDEAEALAERIASPHALSIATMVRAVMAYLGGRWRLAREKAEQAEQILRNQCTGAAWELQTCVFYQLRALEMLGDIATLTSRLPALLAEARERGDLWSGTNLRVRIAHLAYLADDDPEGADRDCRDAIDGWTNRGFHMQHYWALTSRANIAIYGGEPRVAWDLLESHWDDISGSPLMRVQMVRVECVELRARAALAAAAAGGPDAKHLLEAAKKHARRVEREKMAWSDALAALVRAGVAAVEGDEVRAVGLLESAEASFDSCEMPLHAACARRLRGKLVGGAAGDGLVAAADDWLRGQGIVRPERFAAMLAPSDGLT